MNRPVLALTVLLLLSGLPLAAQPTSAVDPAAIRDIRGPLPPTGLPPIAGAVLVLFAAGIGLVVTVTARKKKSLMIVPSPLPLPAEYDLAALREAHARGELPTILLFRHLAGIARTLLVKGESDAMTSAEVLEAASETLPAEMHAVAADLFAVCDRVRFGGCQPDRTTVAEAFDAVQLLLRQQGTPS